MAVSRWLASLAVLAVWRCRVASAPTESIICRQCGEDIGDSRYLYYYPSQNSLRQANVTLFGKTDVHTQILKNPLGIKFNVISTSAAACTGVGEGVSAHSWYPGFVWKFCICPRCSTHLGWIFEPFSALSSETPEKDVSSDKKFYSLIIDNIIGENFVKSLMASPKIFTR